FGGFGKYGAGYDVLFLRNQLQRILNLEQTWPVVLIGAGDLGRAVANYHGFAQGGFEITGVFDNDPAKIGQLIGDLLVQDVDLLEQTVCSNHIRIAIIAVPARTAQAVADRLVDAGVTAILSYAPTTLRVPDQVRVQYVDPVAKLQHMAYYLRT
ncbi:MAG: redox-sensing transcriptional repressor Rex, partial [Clostridia bacterium]